MALMKKTTDIRVTSKAGRVTIWLVTRYQLFGVTVYANWQQVSKGAN